MVFPIVGSQHGLLILGVLTPVKSWPKAAVLPFHEWRG